MALPAGVTTATVIAGVPVTHTGALVKAFVSIEPSAYLVHAATGTPLVDFLEELDISEGVSGQFILPHTDQAGFIDESGNAYTNWYYTARVTYSTPSKAKTKAPKVKVFQLTTGQTTVDLDLLPSGAPALPYIAPTATVNAFHGRTGPVTLQESDLPARLAEEELNATFGPDAPGFAETYAPFPAGRTIVCWGDSLTAGAKAEGGSYPAVLANRLKVPVLKRGFPGDNAKEISYRQGGERLIVTVPGGTIPASGSVSVVLPTDMQVWTAADAVQGTPDGTALVGKLNGIAGKIDIVGSTATFTRTTAGQAQPVPFPLVWQDDFATTHRDAALILWTGRNNIGDFASTVAATDAMIEYSAVPRQFLVLGVTTRTDELTGQLNHTKVVDHNIALASEYGANFLDIRRYLIDNGLADAGITATPADTTAIANDTLPPSLVADDAIHLNPIGYKLVANKVLAKIQELGWVDPADVLAAPAPVAPTVHTITVAGFTRRYLPKALSTSLLDTVITSVPDTTGTGSALAPVVTGSGATLRTSGGMTYLAFDGVNDRMNTALAQAQPYTIAMVYRMKTTGTAKALASLNNGAPSNPQFVRDATGNVYIYAGGTPTTVATPGSGTDWHFAWASVDGANTIVGVDGNVSAAATPGTAAVSGLRLGEGAGSVFTDYDVAEVLFWPSALTAGNMATVRTDVKAGHPGLV